MCRSKDVMPIIRTRKAVTQHGIGRIEKYHLIRNMFKTQER